MINYKNKMLSRNAHSTLCMIYYGIVQYDLYNMEGLSEYLVYMPREIFFSGENT